MLNPNEDTEWNAILREKGILPPKPIEVEDPIVEEPLRNQYDSLTVEQLSENIDILEDEKVDEEEARFLEEYRRKRIAELCQENAKAKFGTVQEISKSDWKTEVNEAGDIYVVIHISQKGHPLCSVIDEHLRTLARKFPMVKFLRGESVLCIPNYPEGNLPTLLIYHEGDLKGQLIGPKSLGGKVATVQGLEWQLSRLAVVETDMTEDPTKRMQISTNRSDNKIIRNDDADHGDSDDDNI